MNEDGEHRTGLIDLAFEHWEVSTVLIVAATAYLVHLIF